ncbi:ABC transporter permease [Actinocorallia lasiicapitis]
MSHPERPGSGPAGTLQPPATVAYKAGGSLADYARQHGLTQSAARPGVVQYIKDVAQRRHFIWAFASSKSISMYTSSKLGQLWQVLTPLLNAGVYFLIFGVLLAQKANFPDYVPWLVAGVFLFSFTQRSVTAGAKSIGGNLSLIRALHFPRATLPLAFTVVEAQQLVVALGVLVVVVLGFGVMPALTWLLVIPVLVLQFAFNIGLSLMVARIGAFTRDITQLIPFILRTWLYASGIIFAIGSLAEKNQTVKDNPWIKDLLEANPGYVYPELVRQNLIPDYAASQLSSHNVEGRLWIYAAFWAVVVLVGGFYWFYRAEERYGRG